jgi:hypothetical protein
MRRDSSYPQQWWNPLGVHVFCVFSHLLLLYKDTEPYKAIVDFLSEEAEELRMIDDFHRKSLKFDRESRGLVSRVVKD